MGILKTLLYLSLFAFPLGVLGRINIIQSAYIYPLDVLLMLIFIVTIVLSIKTKQLSFNNKYVKPLFYFIGFAFLSLLLNIKNLNIDSFLISLSYLLRFILYANLMFAFKFIDSKFADKYKFYLSISGFSIVTLGLIQYFYYPDLGNLYYLDWDKHLNRLFSTFLDPNFAGAIFVLEFILLLSLFQTKFLDKTKKIYLIFSILLTIPAIFLTYSRSSLIMFFVSIILYLVIISKKKYALLILFVFFIGLFLLPRQIGGGGTDLLRTMTITTRQQSFSNALTIFKGSPIYGIGFDSYRFSQKKYGFISEKTWESTHAGAGVSNSFLFVLVTTGIIGFALFLNFWIRVLNDLFIKRSDLVQGRTFPKEKHYFQLALFTSIIGIFVHSLFENTLFFTSVMFWIFLLIGIYNKSVEKD